MARRNEVLITPTRDETLIEEGVATPRFINYIEDLTNKVNNIVTRPKAISGAYTTSTTETLICEGVTTITLDTAPLDGTVVYIKRITDLVTINGTIDNLTTISLTSNYESITLIFSKTLNQWYRF